MPFIPDEKQGSFIPDVEPTVTGGGGEFRGKGTTGTWEDPRGIIAESAVALARGELNVAKGIVGTMGPIVAKMPTMLPAGPGASTFPMTPAFQQHMETSKLATSAAETAKENIASAESKLQPTRNDWIGWGANILMETIPYMGASLAGGYAVGPIGAALVGFSVEGQNAYDDAITSGASEGQAQTERLIIGSINAVIEALQIDKLMKFHKGGGLSLKAFKDLVRKKAYGKMGLEGLNFGKELLKTSITEGIEEFLQEGVSVGIPALLRGEYPKKEDGSPDWWTIANRLGEAAAGGALAGGVLGGAGAVGGMFAGSQQTVVNTEIPATPVVKTEKSVQEPQITEVVEKVFHGTSKEAADIIRVKGFTKEKTIGMTSGGPIKEFVFVSPKKSTATFYSKQNIRFKEGDVVEANLIGKLYVVDKPTDEYGAMGRFAKDVGLMSKEEHKLNLEQIAIKLKNLGYSGIKFKDINNNREITYAVLSENLKVKPESKPIPEQPKRTKKRLLAMAHKIAREKGISDADYREYAELVTGKRSMKDMTQKERNEFTSFLEESFGSPSELIESDFKKPIMVNRNVTTMDEVYSKSIEAVDKLQSKRKKRTLIRKGTSRERLPSKLKDFFFGTDNTPVYHLAQMLDSGEEGIFSDVLDKNIQIGDKISKAHKREVHTALFNMLNEAGITGEDLAKLSSYANPRLALSQKLSNRFSTDTIILELNNQKFEIAKGELIDIYLASQQEDGLRHITNGGLIINDTETGKVSEEDILKIWETVESDKNSNAVVNIVRQIENGIWKPSLNQTSNNLDGKDIATVENWWGLEVFKPSKKLKGRTFTISKSLPELNLIEDKSILKDRTKSKLPLVVRDALAKFTTFENAISDYVGMAEPTRISRTLLNDHTINKVLDQKGYGKILDTIKAIHQRAQSTAMPEGNFSELIHSNLSNMYRAVLIFNPRVVVSQATSAFNYGAYVSPEFITGLKDMVSVDMAKTTLKLSDVAWDRFYFGHSSLELGEAAKSDATLRYWTNTASDANKLGWGMKVADLMALTPGMKIAFLEYEAVRTGKIKGLSAEWWTDKNDLPDMTLEKWQEIQDKGENATPEERQAANIWKESVVERAEYLWQRTQPSWDKHNRSNITSQKGLRKIFLLFRSFHEKSLTIFNQAKLEYDNSAKTIEDKTRYIQRTSAVAASYTANMILRALVTAGLTWKTKDLMGYFKDFITSWTNLFPVFGRVLDSTIRNLINAMTGNKYEYRGEALESLPIEVMNLLLKTPSTFAVALGNLIEGDNEAAEESFKRAMGDLAESLGILMGIPSYEVKRYMSGDEEESEQVTRKQRRPQRRQRVTRRR